MILELYFKESRALCFVTKAMALEKRLVESSGSYHMRTSRELGAPLGRDLLAYRREIWRRNFHFRRRFFLVRRSFLMIERLLR